jgi:hypothetical protein
MSRLHRGTERAVGVTAGVDEAGVVIEEIAAVVITVLLPKQLPLPQVLLLRFSVAVVLNFVVAGRNFEFIRILCGSCPVSVRVARG